MSPPTDRMSAAERREAILAAAVEEFAASGFAGATTADIAKRAGISQPYVFRFFPTKKDLTLAVIDRCMSRIISDWENALPEPGETRLQTLGRTYVHGTEVGAPVAVRVDADAVLVFRASREPIDAFC